MLIMIRLDGINFQISVIVVSFMSFVVAIIFLNYGW